MRPMRFLTPRMSSTATMDAEMFDDSAGMSALDSLWSLAAVPEPTDGEPSSIASSNSIVDAYPDSQARQQSISQASKLPPTR